MGLFNDLKLVLLHMAIAMAIYFVPVLSNVYFIGIVFFFIFKIINAKPNLRTVEILFACGYIVGAEVLLRMTGGGVLYESSKYLVIVFCVMGVTTTHFSQKSFSYVLYLFLLIPGIFLAGLNQEADTVIRKAIAFNLSGPVCLGVAAIFCNGKTITFNHFNKLLFIIGLPIISITTYLFLYNPSVKEVISGTGSNFDTSGGFGPNQVATVLGIGMFVFAVRFFIKSSYKFSNSLNILLLGAISFRAVVTFSRGGVFVGVLMIAIFMFYYFKKSNIKNRKRTSFLIILFLVFGFSIWTVSIIQTGGFIEKRYTNKDALGREKEDLSTGRGQLISLELDAFLENPVFGIGVGKSKEYRLEKTGVLAASHNEMSRILSEHGTFGLMALLILLLTPLVYRIKNKENIFFYSFYVFWLLTINHSAMRIAAPAFIYALCLLNINYEKPTIHRKPIIAKR